MSVFPPRYAFLSLATTLDTTIVDDAEMQSAFACRAFNDLGRGLAPVGFAPTGNAGHHDAYLFVKLFEPLLIGSDLFWRRGSQMRAMGSVGLAVPVFVKKTWHLLVPEFAPNLHIDARTTDIRTVRRGPANVVSVNTHVSSVALVAHVHTPSYRSR
jgi:hypothetical protein